jgi:superfamily I DNA and RNA helicase
VLPPEEIFGKDVKGEPLVRLNLEADIGPRQDIILEKCYRNSRPLLATAHALGFGIYRKLGLVQFFEQDALWSEVGYVVEAGSLEGGQQITLTRTADTSPRFLEDHSPLEDLIQFHEFENASKQREWVVEAIRKDIQVDELRPEDVVVINPTPLSTQKQLGPIREQLLSLGINSELAGVSTSTDVFTRLGAVTFTGIFRAKGNEAGMVYIVNAQDCFSSWSKGHLALVRNRLFTAITRSKAWVRVLGVGEPMRELIREWQALRDNEYKLTFRYPTGEEKRQLRLINVEPEGRRRRLRRYEIRTRDLLTAVEEGDIDADQLIEDVRKAKAASKPK